MKAIVTKYHGPGNVRGARISASDEDGNKIIISYDYSASDHGHRKAAETLCRKMGWTGKLVEGSLKDGRVFVWLDPEAVFSVWRNANEPRKLAQTHQKAA